MDLVHVILARLMFVDHLQFFANELANGKKIRLIYRVWWDSGRSAESTLLSEYQAYAFGVGNAVAFGPLYGRVRR